MAYVTIDNFDETKLSVGEIYAATKPVVYQKIPIRYTYPSGDGPLLVRTPNLFSFGVCENRDVTTEELTGYSMPFVCFDDKEGKNDSEEKFINMMEKITDFIRSKVDELAPQLKKGGRRKPINSDGLNILKYNTDKPNAAPVIYAKMFIEKHDPKKKKDMKISSVFYRKRTEADIKKGVKSVNGTPLVKTTGHNYIKQKCRVIGGLKIESVFVGAALESIQIKLTETVVVKKVNPFKSIMGEDLDLGSDHESDSENASEEEEEEIVQKPKKKEVTVKRPVKKQSYVDPEDDDDEDDDEEDDEDDEDITEALQAIKRRR